MSWRVTPVQRTRRQGRGGTPFWNPGGGTLSAVDPSPPHLHACQGVGAPQLSPADTPLPAPRRAPLQAAARPGGPAPGQRGLGAASSSKTASTPKRYKPPHSPSSRRARFHRRSLEARARERCPRGAAPGTARHKKPGPQPLPAFLSPPRSQVELGGLKRRVNEAR